MVKIAPSVLACDFSRFGEECRNVLKAGADWLHFDIMDGVFVPNLSLGIGELRSIKKAVDAFYDVHLMIIDPIKYVKDFAEAGADIITFHTEAESDVVKTIQAIRDCGKMVGVSVKPATPAEAVFPCLNLIDMVLVMTVEPGFGGQAFMVDQVAKIQAIKAKIREQDLNVMVEVDGGIDATTAPQAIEAGADILVAGSTVFKARNYKKAIEDLRVSAFR